VVQNARLLHQSAVAKSLRSLPGRSPLVEGVVQSVKKLGLNRLPKDHPSILRQDTTYIIVRVDGLLVADDTNEAINKVMAEINEDLLQASDSRRYH
jgi:hypothetical protein